MYYRRKLRLSEHQYFWALRPILLDRVTLLCDWICENRSYQPWQVVQFYVTNTKVASLHYQVSLLKWGNLDLCCRLIIIFVSYEPCIAHNKLCFIPSSYSTILFMSSLPTFRAPCHPPIVELAWYYHIARPILIKKNYPKWLETCFLATYTEDGIKHKELLNNV